MEKEQTFLAKESVVGTLRERLDKLHLDPKLRCIPKDPGDLLATKLHVYRYGDIGTGYMTITEDKEEIAILTAAFEERFSRDIEDARSEDPHIAHNGAWGLNISLKEGGRPFAGTDNFLTALLGEEKLDTIGKMVAERLNFTAEEARQILVASEEGWREYMETQEKEAKSGGRK